MWSPWFVLDNDWNIEIIFISIFDFICYRISPAFWCEFPTYITNVVWWINTLSSHADILLQILYFLLSLLYKIMGLMDHYIQSLITLLELIRFLSSIKLSLQYKVPDYKAYVINPWLNTYLPCGLLAT